MYIVDKQMYVKEKDDFVILDSSVFDTLDSAKIACLVLNAISRSYTKRANEQALAHIKYIYKCTDKDIEEFKRKYNYKTNSYVVLERCIVRKGGLK